MRVILDKDKLAESGIDFLGVANNIRANNQEYSSGSFNNGDEEFIVKTGSFLKTEADLLNLIVGVHRGSPIYLKQVGKVIDGPELPSSYVSFGYAQASGEKREQYYSEYPAVTLSVSKRKGADAMKISEKIMAKVERVKETILPDDVHVEVSRNYGENCIPKSI